VLRLSLSVSAHHCPSLLFLASSAALCIVLFRSAVRTPPHTTLDGGGGGYSSRGGDSKHQLSPAPAPALSPAPNASSITHWDPVGREAIERGSRTSLSAHHRLQLSPLRNHHRIAVSWAPRTATLSHGLAGSHDRAHSSLQLHPHRHRRLTHPLSRASLPAPPLRRACCCPRSHCPAPNQRPVAGFRFSSAHTPTPACTRLATLVPLTLIRPPSCCTTRCDAWLTRVADSSTLPTDSLACLLACFDCETLSPPLLRFRALRIPSSPSPNSGFARLHVHKRLLVLDFASLRLATLTPSRAPLIDPVTVT
jgi:hypothetical protein